MLLITYLLVNFSKTAIPGQLVLCIKRASSLLMLMGMTSGPDMLIREVQGTSPRPTTLPTHQPFRRHLVSKTRHLRLVNTSVCHQNRYQSAFVHKFYFGIILYEIRFVDTVVYQWQLVPRFNGFGFECALQTTSNDPGHVVFAHMTLLSSSRIWNRCKLGSKRQVYDSLAVYPGLWDLSIVSSELKSRK